MNFSIENSSLLKISKVVTHRRCNTLVSTKNHQIKASY